MHWVVQPLVTSFDLMGFARVEMEIWEGRSIGFGDAELLSLLFWLGKTKARVWN